MRARQWLLAQVSVIALVAAACDSTGSRVPTPTPTVQVAAAPLATMPPTPAPPPPTPPPPPPTPTRGPRPEVIYVGNTDGEGVFLRKLSAIAERTAAYDDGTPLVVIGEAIQAYGESWLPVRAPDGVEGWVPERYTVDTPPPGVPPVVLTPRTEELPAAPAPLETPAPRPAPAVAPPPAPASTAAPAPREPAPPPQPAAPLQPAPKPTIFIPPVPPTAIPLPGVAPPGLQAPAGLPPAPDTTVPPGLPRP